MPEHRHHQVIIDGNTETVRVELVIPFHQVDQAFALLATQDFWSQVHDGIKAAVCAYDLGISQTKRNIDINVKKQ